MPDVNDAVIPADSFEESFPSSDASPDAILGDNHVRSEPAVIPADSFEVSLAPSSAERPNMSAETNEYLEYTSDLTPDQVGNIARSITPEQGGTRAGVDLLLPSNDYTLSAALRQFHGKDASRANEVEYFYEMFGKQEKRETIDRNLDTIKLAFKKSAIEADTSDAKRTRRAIIDNPAILTLGEEGIANLAMWEKYRDVFASFGDEIGRKSRASLFEGLREHYDDSNWAKAGSAIENLPTNLLKAKANWSAQIYSGFFSDTPVADARRAEIDRRDGNAYKMAQATAWNYMPREDRAKMQAEYDAIAAQVDRDIEIDPLLRIKIMGAGDTIKEHQAMGQEELEYKVESLAAEMIPMFRNEGASGWVQDKFNQIPAQGIQMLGMALTGYVGLAGMTMLGGAEVRETLKAKGVSNEYILPAMIAGGGIEAWIEKMQVGGLRKIFGGAGVKNAFTKLGFWGAVKYALKEGSKQGGEEVLQSLSKIAITEGVESADKGEGVGKSLSDMLSETYNSADGLAGEFFIAFVMGLGMAGGGSVRLVQQGVQARRQEMIQAKLSQSTEALSENGELSPVAKTALEQVAPDARGSLNAALIKKYQDANPDEARAIADAVGATQEQIDAQAEEDGAIGFNLAPYMAKVSQTSAGLALGDHISINDNVTIDEGRVAMREVLSRGVNAVKAFSEFASGPVTAKKLRIYRKDMREAGFSDSFSRGFIHTLLSGGERLAKMNEETIDEWFARVNPRLVFDEEGMSLLADKELQNEFDRVLGKDEKVADPQYTDIQYQAARVDLDLDTEIDVLEVAPRYAEADIANARNKKRALNEQIAARIVGVHENPPIGLRDGGKTWRIAVSKNNIKHFMNSLTRRGLGGALQLEAIDNLPSLIERAVRVERSPPKKTDPDTKEVHRLYAAMRVDGVVYPVKITVKERFGQFEFESAEIDQGDRRAYDLSIEKRESGRNITQNSQGEGSALPLPDSAYRIRDLVKNVKGDDGNILAQGNESSPRGSIEFRDAETIITILRKNGGDESSMLHELYHMFEEEAKRIAESNPKTKFAQAYADLDSFSKEYDEDDVLEKWYNAGAKSTPQWGGREFADLMPEEKEIARSVAKSEHRARAWEAWLRDGKAPSLRLARAFAIFKKYLLDIYSDIQSYVGRDEIPEGMHDFFRRLLATEDERAEAEMYYRAAQPISMIIADNEEKRKKGRSYHQKIEEAKERALETATQQYHEQAIADFEAWIDETGGHEGIRERAVGTVKSQPQYAALAALDEFGGIMGLSLDDATRDALAAVHGDDLITVDESGADSEQFNAIAKKHGFADSAELISTLVESEAIDEAIETEYQAQYDAEFQEFEQERRAERNGEALHSDALVDYLWLDGNALREQAPEEIRAKMKQVTAQAQRDEAHELISKAPITQATSPFYWGRREAKAAQQAVQAIAEGNMAEAYNAQMRRAVYAAALQESVKNREKIAKAERRYMSSVLSRMDKPASKVELGHRNLVLGLVNLYGLNRKVAPPSDFDLAKAMEALITAKPVDDTDGIGAMATKLIDFIPDWVLVLETKEQTKKEKERNLKQYRMLTMDEFEELDRTIQKIISEGRGELATMEGTVDELANELIELLEQRDPLKAKPKGGAVYAADFMLALTKAQTIFEYADGSPLMQGKAKGGHSKLFDSVHTKLSELEVAKMDVREQLQPHLKVLSAAKRRLHKKYKSGFFPIKGAPLPKVLSDYPIGAKGYTADYVFAICLNSGNASNLYTLKESVYGLTEENLRAIRAELTAEEWQAIQGIWDTLDAMGDNLADTFFKLYNRKLTREEAQQLTIRTSDRKTITLRGGYYPLKYDGEIDLDAAGWNEKATIMDEMNSRAVNAKVKADRGMTIDRVKDENGNPVVKRPPLLSTTGVLDSHIDKTLRFTIMSETLNDVDRLMRHVTKDENGKVIGGWRVEFEKRIGKGFYGDARKWMSSMASERMPREKAHKWQGFIRGLTIKAGLTFRVLVGYKQRLSTIQAASEMAMRAGAKAGDHAAALKYIVKANYRIGGVGFMFGAGAKIKAIEGEITSKDVRMKARQKNISREISDTMNHLRPLDPESSWIRLGLLRLGAPKSIFDTKDGVKMWMNENGITDARIEEIAFAWIYANDRATTIPIYLAAMDQAIDLELNGIKHGMHPDEIDVLARDYASDVVFKTQPSSLQADLSEAQRGDGWYLFMMFQTFRNNFLQRTIARVLEASQGTPGAKKELARHILVEHYGQHLAVLLLTSAAYGGDDEDWEMTDLLFGPISDSLALLPFVDTLKRGIEWGQRGFETPAFGGFDKGGKNLYYKATKNGPFSKEFAWSAYQATEFWTGLNVSNAWRDIERIILDRK